MANTAAGAADLHSVTRTHSITVAASLQSRAGYFQGYSLIRLGLFHATDAHLNIHYYSGYITGML